MVYTLASKYPYIGSRPKYILFGVCGPLGSIDGAELSVAGFGPLKLRGPYPDLPISLNYGIYGYGSYYHSSYIP